MGFARLAPVGAAVAAVVGLMAMPAAAAAPTIALNDGVRTGNTATVSGTAAFTELTEAVSVGGANTQFANPAVADGAGVDLVDAKIEPLPGGAGLRFIWQLTNLPEQGALPEAVRYTWSFRIGETQYQLQAKSSNLASITTAENPVGHVQQAAAQEPFFQLRGACVTQYEGMPVSGCYHLAFLDGRFDAATDTVSVDLPYNTRDYIGRLVAPDFVPGAIVEENVTANMSITAAFQAVAGNTYTSDYINGWTPYHTGERVDLAVGGVNSAPAGLVYDAQAALAADGNFTGTVSGLTTNANTVYARACTGIDCSYAKITPTTG